MRFYVGELVLCVTWGFFFWLVGWLEWGVGGGNIPRGDNLKGA